MRIEMRGREQGGKTRPAAWRIRLGNDSWALIQSERMAAMERVRREDISAVRSSGQGSAGTDVGSMGAVEQVGGEGRIGSQGRATIAAEAGAAQHSITGWPMAAACCTFHAGKDGSR